jgi:hypothetical protein
MGRGLLLCLGLAMACGSRAAGQIEAIGQAGPVEAAGAKPAQAALSTVYGVAIAGVPGELLLDPVNNQAFIQEDLVDPPACKSIRYAVGRDVPWVAGAGTWYPVDAAHGGGRLWVCDVTSPTAFGLRVHLNQMQLPAGAQLVVFDPANPAGLVDGPYEGRGVHDSGEMWTLTIFNQTARVEVYVPLVTKGNAAPVMNPGVVIDRVQHAYRDFNQVFSSREGACYNDVTCFPAWANTARASAGIGIIGNNSLYCSGTMLQSLNADLTPYFLTANHCLSTAATAQNSEIYWLYQSATCNAGPPALSSVAQSNVCTLLSTSANSDYTLLMVEGTIPRASLFWAGWTSGGVADGTLVAGIHHPAGAYKRISFGTKASNVTCGNANHIRSNWYATNGTLSVTEPGSSGSGLFLQSNQQLVGQLHCGPSACGIAAANEHDDYGAFSVTYGNVSGFLAGGTDDGFEPNDTCATARSIGSGSYSNLIVKSTSDDWYAISVPGGGGTLSVQLSFTHQMGDIDMQLLGSCAGAALATSAGTSNSETITYTNTGATATFYVHVYLFSDTRNSYSMNISAVAPVPPNDGCANANVIGVGTYTGTTVGAFNDGPTNCGLATTNGPDVWYAFTAGCNGTLKIDTCGTAFDTAVSVHTGCPGTTANQLACNDDCAIAGLSCTSTTQSCLTLAASSGTTYYIRMGGFNGASGAYVLHVILDAGLPNDSCASATPIGIGTVNGTTCGATNDGSASCGLSAASVDVWYSFTPSCTGTLLVDTCGSGYDTTLSVHSGCPGTSSNELACNDDCVGGGCGGLQSCLSVAVTGGTGYLIRVSGFAGANGSFTLHTGLTPPNNDNCSNATQILPGTYAGGTCGATVDGSAACGLSASSNDVWYAITPATSGLARLDTCTSTYDTVVSVHTSCPGVIGNQIGCNDDAPLYTACTGTFQSALDVPVTAGSTYYIRVAGFNGSTGNYTLHYTLGGLVNETCPTATPVNFGTYAFNTTGATTDGPTEANCTFCCSDLQINQDIWYTIVAPCNRVILIDTIGSTYDTKLGVYAGCPFANNSAVACDDDGGGSATSSVAFTPVAGTAYYIRVGGFNSGAGAGTLHIRTCLADFNCNGTLEVQDIFDFLNAWFAGNPRADFNFVNGLEIQDIFDFLNAWFAGC